MSEETPDRIERRAVLRAPKGRVWRAISDAAEFGEWFMAKLEGGFARGEVTRGHITYPGYEQLKLEMLVERIEPERLFAYRWHPYAMDPDYDYSAEPMTLVEFRLEDAEGGTLVTVIESGFERIPEARREEAYQAHAEGWAEQMDNIRRYVEEG